MAYETAQALYLDVTRSLPSQLMKGFDYILGLFNDAQRDISVDVLLPNLQADEVVAAPSVTYTASTISFIEATSTIADSASGFVTAGFAAGDTIKIHGCGDEDNNQAVRITSVAAGAIVVSSSVDDESASESITLTSDRSAMPSNYQRNLHRVYSLAQGTEVKIYDSLAAMISDMDSPYINGGVSGIAVRAGYLHFQSIPQVDSDANYTEYLQLFYQKSPTNMTTPASTPADLPEHLARQLLVNYALWKVYESAGANSTVYQEQYARALMELRGFSGPAPKGRRGFRG